MTLNLTMPGQDDLKPRITVFGVGGAGGNAVNNMIDKALEGVEFVVANTDAQALAQSKSQARIQMGVKVTEGLGAGARATVGAAAAEESIEQIVDHLAGAHMCFITAGMGGGTGTGAAPIIAQAARELGVLTVGVVTKPFQFEGAKRMRQAEEGVESLQKMVDTLIIIPNQNLFRLANEKTTFTEAFSMADDVLYQGVKGISDLMVQPGLINLDFADVRSVMDEMGKAMMGTGEADGEDRAIQAAEKAIANPLLDEISLKGARGVLINITGGYDLTLFELDEAANRIREEVDPDANIIVGSTLDTNMEGGMRVSVVATGIDATESHLDVPVPRRSLAEPLANPSDVEHSFGHDAPTFSNTQAAEAEAEDYSSRYAASEPQRAEPQTSFFDEEIDPTAAAAEEQAENIFPVEEAGDDVPAPVFQAQPRYEPAQQPAPQPAPRAEQGVAQFVAPKSPQPGQPSPETLARLEAAVSRSRSGEGQPAAQPRDAQGGGAERPRFGINSLINRMTGQGAEAQAEQRHEPQPRPAQEPTQETDPDQERVEIPAFLRRQAN
ncbi:cell division protein FtsZ [Maritimibacter sp. UBA3975]|uniref:cell division protein FtsZ n=1 Tax=Maritimibacter sp. UBA3975 TaxID=1946833 RepID=UPI000C09D81D|nr:cell division protein FtsZ [Maritimibacter sp. UBA3975]MAM61630.1 cell division protein FtsZ [Maritimibacter sp.]|tara:strand:- start:25507 stop:27165 length:1659 start_codon:yes stop_codon:yes gene_type:complete